MVGNIRRGAGEISRTRFYRRENPIFTVPGILSGRPAGENVPPARARVRTSSTGQSVGRSRGVSEEIIFYRAIAQSDRKIFLSHFVSVVEFAWGTEQAAGKFT